MLISRPRALPPTTAFLAAALGLAMAPVAAADCNQNGIDDFVDVTRGAADCNGNGVPDPCELLPVNPGFRPRTSIPTETPPFALLADDIDEDGNVDLAAVLSGSSTILIAWRGLQGDYITDEHFARGTGPDDFNGAFAAGDMDSNGLPDIVAGGPTGASVLFQNLARNFVPRGSPIESESALGSLALSDLDGDGDLDVAFAGRFDVHVFPNHGDGTFADARSFPAGSGPVHLIAADVDGDGDEDIATSNFLQNDRTGSVSIFLNRGAGNLGAPRNFAVGDFPRSISAGDLDNDGSLDLLTANSGSSDLSILLGGGDGTFAGHARIPAPAAPLFAALGNLDGDLDLDIAVARSGSGGTAPSGAVSLFWNHGGGVLRRAGEMSLGSLLPSIAIRDVTGDGSPEIVVANGARNEIQLLEDELMAYADDCDRDGSPDECNLAEGDCNANGLPDGCDIASGRSRDCDRDGRPDECEPDCNANNVADDCDMATGTSTDCNRNGLPDDCDVFAGEPGFGTFFLAGEGAAFDSLAARDVDADGRPDLLTLDISGEIDLFWGAGNLGFDPVTRAATGRRGWVAAAGDTDGDGDLDLVLGNPTLPNLDLVLQSAPRSFAVPSPIVIEEEVVGLCTADFDGDGLDDVVAAGKSGDLHFASGRAEGTLGPARRTVSRLGPALAAADLDSDGAVDIACVLADGRAAIVWNDGGAAFSAPALLPTLFRFTRVAVADLDGDGDRDVAALGERDLFVFFQSSRRTFELKAEVKTSDAFALVLADVDRNGLDDIVLAHGGSRFHGIEVLRIGGNGSFDLASAIRILPGGDFGTLAAADLDGDGATDLVAGLRATPSFRAFILRNITTVPRSTDRNGDGRPDECDRGAFHRGDSDGDGSLGLADAVFTLRFLFQGETPPGCSETADVDNDGFLTLSDPVLVLEFLFRGGPPPASPGPPPGPCGLDPDAPGGSADLGCAAYPGC